MHAAQHGSQPGCIVCALPFIRPRDVQQSQAGQSAQDKQQALQAAIAPTTACMPQPFKRSNEMQASQGASCPSLPPAI
jgi:exonuclease SbcD